MKSYNVWIMPEEKVKGSEPKWQECDEIRAKNRKLAAQEAKKMYGNSWKLRLSK